MIEKHYKRQLITLKRRHIVPTVITIIKTLTRSKQLPFLGYQKSDPRIASQTGPNL